MSLTVLPLPRDLKDDALVQPAPGDLLHQGPDPEHVLAADPGQAFVRVSPSHQLGEQVGVLADVTQPVRQFAIDPFEIRADPNMFVTNQLDDVIDVIRHVREVRCR